MAHHSLLPLSVLEPAMTAVRKNNALSFINESWQVHTRVSYQMMKTMTKSKVLSTMILSLVQLFLGNWEKQKQVGKSGWITVGYSDDSDLFDQVS